jgi:hypothetical protein
MECEGRLRHCPIDRPQDLGKSPFQLLCSLAPALRSFRSRKHQGFGEWSVTTYPGCFVILTAGRYSTTDFLGIVSCGGTQELNLCTRFGGFRSFRCLDLDNRNKLAYVLILRG